MSKTKVAINGFGRIGRTTFRAALLNENCNYEIVAVNDLTSPDMLAHLLKYDSVMRQFPGDVRSEGNELVVTYQGVERRITVTSEREPAKLPWASMGIDIVLECTGFFTDATQAKGHIEAGAKKVLISAPAKNEDITIALGINCDQYNPDEHHIISNASCTTNCLAPVAKVIHEAFGIENGLMTTIHSYTGDQKLVDAPHKDFRRARSGALSMIPTSTGAAKAIALVMPELQGRLNGFAVRVPTPDVSMVDLTVTVSKPVTKEAVDAAMRNAANGPLKGILEFADAPLVSNDFIGNAHSSIYDADLTYVSGDRLLKIGAWYDNEWGYSNRLAELAQLVANKIAVAA